jgi:BMFP domain-containing protein YqiC
MLRRSKLLKIKELWNISGFAAPSNHRKILRRTILVQCALSVRDGGVNGGASPARYNHSMSQFTPNPTLDKLTNLAQRVGEAIAASPAGELEKNARQHFISQLAKQGLVTREEFDAQRALLEKTRAKLQTLEEKIAALENKSA